MLAMRLQRIGGRGRPAHRIVVQDSRQSPKSGRVIEILGSYNPHLDHVTVNAERATHWIGNGAQVSGTVHNILVSEGVIKGAKRNVLPKKRPIITESSEEEKPAGTAEKDTDATDTQETGTDTEASAEAKKEVDSAEAKADEKEEEETETPKDEKGKDSSSNDEASAEEPKTEEPQEVKEKSDDKDEK